MGFVLMSFRLQMVGLAMMAMIYFASSVLEPVSLGYLHHHAIEKYRATIESAFSVIEHLAVALLGVPFGLISTQLRIFQGFLFLSGILMILAIWSTLWFKEY